MGKCVKCGRHGLFVRVNGDGLCATCQGISEAIAAVANAVTGSRWNCKPSKPEKTIIPKRSTYLKDRDGKRITKKDYSSIFDMSAFSELINNTYQIDGEHNRSIVQRDAVEMVKLAKALEVDAFDIPHVETDGLWLDFSYVESRGQCNTTAQFGPKYNGKMPNPCMTIGFAFDEDLFGVLEYDKNELCGGKIIKWRRTKIEAPDYVRLGGTCWVARFIKIDEKMELFEAIKTIDGKHQVIYRRRKK